MRTSDSSILCVHCDPLTFVFPFSPLTGFFMGFRPCDLVRLHVLTPPRPSFLSTGPALGLQPSCQPCHLLGLLWTCRVPRCLSWHWLGRCVHQILQICVHTATH